MFKYSFKDLERWSKLTPKADYSNLEMFLRTVKYDDLAQLNVAAINIRQGISQPYEQIFMIIVLANIFLNEYGQELFTKTDYVKLFSIFATSVFYEVSCRNRGIENRLGEWRELRPNQIEKYKVYEDQ